jgi:DNA-binding SARP family transcriptional activator
VPPQAVRFEILGPLAIHRGDQVVRLGSPQQRKVLAVLLISDRLVTADELVDALWGEKPPPTAAGTLQTHISRLRMALGGGPALLPHDAGGYHLEVGADPVDARRFRGLVEEGSAADDVGDDRRARELLAEALSLWRGPALQDFRYEPFAQTEIASLEGLRITALEKRIGLDLALGGDAQLCSELETLIEEYPLREELHGLLIVALYRSGRQAEALAVYRRLHETLVHELGVEPTPKLRALERDVLDQSPTLMPPAAATAATTPALQVPSGALHSWMQSLDVPALDAKKSCELLLARGAGLRRSGNELGARNTYAAAVRLATASGSPEQLADAALGLAGPPEDTVLGEELDEALLERAIRALPERRPVLAMLRARLAVALIDRGEVDRGNEMADNAIAFARSADSRAALAYALRARHRTWFDPHALQPRLALGSELIELGLQLGDPEVLAWGHRWHATDLLETGDLTAFASELDELEALAGQLHDAFHWWGVILRRAGVAFAREPPPKAEPLVMEALGLAAQIQSPYTLATSMLAFWVLRWHQGRLDALREAILAVESASPPYAFLVPYLHKELGDKVEAANSYQRLATDDFTDLLGRDPSRVSRLFALTALTDLAWYVRDRDRARTLHDLLSPLAGQWAVINPGITPIAPIDHPLGQLQALMEDRDHSAAHFETALDQCNKGGAPTLAVRTQVAYAEMLRELGGQADRDRARQLLASAREAADELGLAGVVRHIDAEPAQTRT